MSQQPISTKTLIALCIFGLLVWFGTLDLRKLVKPDEGRYAEISREMAISGDWVTPRLNNIKYFEKPPMQYWATALAFKIFGFNEWTARLWTALAGFLSMLLVYWAGCKLFGQDAGIYGAFALISNVYFVGLGHVNTLDMGLTLFTTLTLICFCIAQSKTSSEKIRKWYMLAAWVGMAFAVLSKGLVGIVLPGMTLFVYSFAGRDWRIWQRLYIIPGLIIFLLITAPWFIAVSLANPEFAWFFFVHEHFLRYATPAARRDGAVYYFIPILLGGILPWIILMAESLWAGGREFFQEKTDQDRAVLILMIWIIFIFGFFSLSSSKLPAYILPIFPALALLIGKRLASLDVQQLSKRILFITFLTGILFAWGRYAATYTFTAAEKPLQHAYSDWLLTGVSVLFAGTIISLWYLRRHSQSLAITAFAIAGFIASHILLVGHNTFAPTNSAYELAEKIRPELKDNIPFYSVKMYDQTLPFYINRTLTLVDYWDEFSYGLQQEPNKAIRDIETFHQVWLQNREALAIMQSETYHELAKYGTYPMQLIVDDGKRAVVKKPL